MKSIIKGIKKLVTISVTIWVFNLSLFAQEEHVSGKLFYTELGGPGVAMSANFDKRFDSNSRLGFGFRVGAGFGRKNHAYYDFDGNYQGSLTYYSFPVGLNYVFGKPNCFKTFEVGVGLSLFTQKVSFYNYNEKDGNVIGFLAFMYRSMPLDGGFSWRIGLTPIIGTSGNMFPMGAIGIGYVF